MIVIADSDRAFHARVSEQLGHGPQIQGVYNIPELERLLAERAGEVNVIFLGPSLPSPDALAFAGRVQVIQADVSIIFVANTLTSDLLQTALRSGVRDVLPAAFTSQQLVEAVGRAEALSRQMRERSSAPTVEADEGADHRIITVFSSKGGTGKSFVASNLAVLLAQRSREEVAMVDLDLQFGDLAIMLQLFPARTMYDAAQNLSRLDADALKGYLTPHRSLVYLLPAPLEPGLAETISAEATQRITRMLKQKFRYVIIDTPPAFTDHVLAALDESDDAVLITTMDVPSIKNLKLSLQTLELLGIGRDRIKLVLNRADSKVGLRVQEVEKTLRTSVDVAIPSSRDVPLSINQGVPLVIEDPKSPVVAALQKLADKVTVSQAAVPQQEQQPRQQPGGRFRLRRR